MSEQKAPEVWIHGDPVPEGATALCSVPEELRTLISTIDTLMTETSEKFKNLPEDKMSDEHAIALKKFKMEESRNKILLDIFWSDTRQLIEEEPETGALIISKDWQIYAEPEKPSCNCFACRAMRATSGSGATVHIITFGN